MSERLVRQIPLPAAVIRADPAARGLTGLETRVWVDGYDGHPVTATVNELGARVDVEATPESFRWDFGDGSAVVEGDLGRPPPQRSTVTHTYDRPSGGEPFTVTLTFVFSVRYRVNGGPWTTLPPVTRGTHRSYPVAEARSQLRPE